MSLQFTTTHNANGGFHRKELNWFPLQTKIIKPTNPHPKLRAICRYTRP